MATKALTLLRTARKASIASRAAAMASRSARVTGVAVDIVCAARLRSDDFICQPKSWSIRRFPSSADYEHLPEDSKTPTDKDFESDDAVWTLYERWCQAFGKKRDYAEMTRRFEIFRRHAEFVHKWNTGLPADPKKAAICLRKRRQAKLLLSKGKDVSHFEDWHLPAMLGPLADGGDPFLREYDYNLLKNVEKRDVRRAPKDVTVE